MQSREGQFDCCLTGVLLVTCRFSTGIQTDSAPPS
nr:unnamed protein product [Callosobruchus chinensis]CAH7751040.1 unnamed protein product [Callosobruchus chinensis]